MALTYVQVIVSEVNWMVGHPDGVDLLDMRKIHTSGISGEVW